MRTADASVSELGLHGRRRLSLVIDGGRQLQPGEPNRHHENSLSNGGLYITRIIYNGPVGTRLAIAKASCS